MSDAAVATMRRAGRRVAAAVCAAVALASATAADAPRILSPAADATVHDNSGRVEVVVVDVPSGARLVPQLDGEPVADAPIAAAAFELRDVPRGSHVLEVEFVDARGRVVGRTAPVVFHLWRASRLFRQP